jgi:hypothetical protein
MRRQNLFVLVVFVAMGCRAKPKPGEGAPGTGAVDLTKAVAGDACTDDATFCASDHRRRLTCLHLGPGSGKIGGP